MMQAFLRDHKIGDLVVRKQQLIQVPYTSTVGDVINAYLTDDVLAYPITAPPNEWIGALGGGSSVLESDPSTGLPTKQYIGVISVLDVLMHFADNADNIEWALEAPVEKLVGRSIEGLNLIVLRPDTTILAALDTLAKGVHRVLVPQTTSSLPGTPRSSRRSDGFAEAGSNYHFLTQTDVIRFVVQNEEAFAGLLSKTVQAADVIHASVLSIPAFMLMVDALRCMRNAAVSVAQPITAIAVVEADHATFPEAEEPMMVQGKGLKVVGTLAASHLRGVTTEVLKGLPYLTVIDFLSRVSMARRFGFGAVHKDGSRRSSLGTTPRSSDDGAGTSEDAPGPRAPVTCSPETPLGEVLKQALKGRTRQVWVTDPGGLLSGQPEVRGPNIDGASPEGRQCMTQTASIGRTREPLDIAESTRAGLPKGSSNKGNMTRCCFNNRGAVIHIDAAVFAVVK
ncbi:Cystathionine beta-synthase family protein [Klebsormidium nitens]|uniref:Cystathionine beta-synthase family protein n=1 Tax=Klebsormidium nitens TaxID=105231 RepID=A0A1Y1HLL0_KLENI|nr:Cystathionine beta-synthase family protein [Klebsormidium nitens]|eukprot:GAQ78049.1 Cystathionine beta-synthase family protein [Klebsormidium nitens]